MLSKNKIKMIHLDKIDFRKTNWYAQLSRISWVTSICALMCIGISIPNTLQAQDWSITSMSGTLGTTPEAADVNTCYELGGELTFRLSAATAQSNPVLSIDLATGREYVAGSVMITGSVGGPFSIGANTGTVTDPTFTISGNFAPGDYVNISIEKVATCGAASGLTDRVTVGTEQATSTTHDVLSVNLAASNLSSTSVIVGGTGVLSGDIVAGGTGCIEEFELVLTDALPNLTTTQLTIGGVVLTPTMISGNTRTYLVTDFSAVGDNDNCFEAGETISFQRDISLSACDDFSSVGLEASWGCNGMECQSTDFVQQVINVGGGIGDLNYLSGSYRVVQSSNFCTNWIVETAYVNDASAGPAYNVVLGAGYNNAGITAANTGQHFLVNGFVNGQVIPVSGSGTSASPLSSDMSVLTSDPDGPGGLDDIDGDGQFDDIAPGDTVIWQTEWRRAACRDICPANYGTQLLKVQTFYSDICGTAVPTQSPSAGGISRTNNSPNGSLIFNGPANIFEGDVATVTATISRNHNLNRNGGVFQCPDDSLVVRVTTPPGVRIVPGSATVATNSTGAGLTAVDVTAINDTTYLIDGFLDDDATRIFEFDIESMSGMCDPVDQDFEIDIYYICDATCDCIEEYVCDFIWTPIIICDSPCPTGGLRMRSVSAERQTLGFTDQTGTTKVSKDDVSQQWLETATHCDTICWSFTSIQENGSTGPSWDSLGLHVEYLTYSAGIATFDFIEGGELIWFDASTGSYINCNVGLPTMDAFDGDKHIADWDLSSCLSGGMLEPGDTIFSTIKAIVSLDANIPATDPSSIDSLTGWTFNIIDGTPISCSAPLAIPQRLHTYSLRHPFGDAGYTEGCDDVAPSENYNHLFGSSSLSYYPEEYRFLFRIDSVRYQTDLINVVYNEAGSNIFYRYSNNTGEVNLPIVTEAKVDDTYTVIVNDGSWPNTDARSSGRAFRFRGTSFLPTCESVDGIIPVEIFYTEGINSSDPNCHVSRVHTWNRIVDFDFAEFDLSNLTGTAEATGEMVMWEVDVSNISNISTANLWVAFEGLDVSIDSILDVAADTFLNIQNFTDGEWTPVKGSFTAAEEFSLKVFGTIDSCTNQEVTMYVSASCDTFPTEPNEACYMDSTTLSFRLPPTAVQIGLSQDMSQEIYNFCDVINDTIMVISADAGNIFDVSLRIVPADGLMEDDLMVQIEYPQGSGAIETVSATTSGDTLIVNVSDHSGIASGGISGTLDAATAEESNALVIVNWLVGCEFRDGAVYSAEVFAYNRCGEESDGSGVNTMSSPIPGLQQASTYEIDLSMSQDTVFNCDTNMINILTEMILGNSTEMDSIYITLPLTSVYVDGSYECVAPTPAGSCPELVEVRQIGDTSIMVLSVPFGVLAPTEVSMSFDIEVTPASICLDSSELRIEIIQYSPDIPCPALGAGTICDGLVFILADTARTLYFDPVEFEICNDTILCYGEEVPLIVKPSPEDSCIVTAGVWRIIQGSGELENDSSLQNLYTPSEADAGTNVLIEFSIPEDTSVLLSDCNRISDTVMICYSSPYVNCHSHVNFSCGQTVTVNDILADDIDEKFHFLYTIELTDEFGRTIPNPLPPEFVGEFWANISYECSELSCETTGSVDNKRGCVIEGNLDTTIWCVDDFLNIDPNGSFYRDTLKLRPYAVEHCSYDTLEVEYEGEWINNFACGDTLKQVIRGWKATTKAGNSCVSYDTITLIRLPDVTDYIYAPQKDTVLCEYDSTYWYTFKKKYFSWKDLVNLHSNGSTVRYPIYDNNLLFRDIEAIYEAWYNISDEEVKDSLRDEYEDCPVILRWNSVRGAYDEIDLLELYEAYLGGNVLFDYEIVDGVEYAIWNVKLGDKIMTNGGAYLEVTNDWFYEKEEHGFWIDLTVPEISYTRELSVCDVWTADKCRGAKLILPDHPYSPDSCKIFCLDDGGSQSKCLDVVYVEVKDLGGNCPRVVKRHTIIKQSCIADGDSIATLDDLQTNCPNTADRSGVVRSDSLGGNIHIEIDQWIVFIDTLGPLLDEKGINEKELVFQTSTHDCYGEVTLPSIKVKDVCSGVKEVKATLGYNNGWLIFEDADGDGVWEQEEGRNIRLACGENYPVQYELLDSCHNVTELTRHWVGVEDLISPVVLTPDTVNINLSTKEIWIDAETFDIGSADNCGIARVLVRRPDWLESCGVDVCSEELAGISSRAELDAYISANGYFANFNDNAVERDYADQYEWLLNDGDWCNRAVSEGVLTDRSTSEGTAKADKSRIDNLKDMLLDGWRTDIYNYWATNCVGRDEHSNPLIKPSTGFSLGGGWGRSVPICCEDACAEVVVEVMVIDKSCNYTKGWVVLNVESNQPVVEACEFDELTIGCSAYTNYYAPYIEAAQSGEAGAHEALDSLLGSLVKGWRSSNGVEDGVIYDYNGVALSKEQTYITTECRIEVIERKLLDTLHDGTVVWETVKEGRQVVEEVERTVDLGGVYVTCNASCEQSVWVELNDCGVGRITRRWAVNGNCNGNGLHNDPPVVIDQVIHITSDCEMTKYSFNIPNDTMVCGDLIYELNSNVELDIEQMTYALGDVDCRQLGITHTDEVFTVLGEPNLRKIHRTWRAVDWCNNEEVECVQKIVLDMGCSDQSQSVANSEQLEGDEEELLARRQKSFEGKFELMQNAPNPFTESTVIRFNLPEATQAKLTIFDLGGRVLHSVKGNYSAGLNQVLIESDQLADKELSGVLIYQLETQTHSATKQMTILK